MIVLNSEVALPGRLSVSSRTAGLRCATSVSLPGGWHLAIEPELHLGPDVLVPDLAGWRSERMPAFPDAPFFTLAPDWVCEILSPGTRHFDLTEKRGLYRRNGVAHLWLVDPDARTLDAFTLTAGAWTLAAAFQDADAIRATPFESLTFPLNALWPD